jgi:enoyl-CoA hydratase/carnithine racemase
MISTPLEVVADGDLATLTLNRPDNANALSPELVEALIAALENPGSARMFVLRGAGRLFCAGFDLDDFEELSDGDLLWRFLRIEHLLQTVYHSPIPIMGLAHGHAIGAGADLLAATSFRVMAPGTKARMPGLHFELTLGTRRLARLVGEDTARDILIDTRTFEAKEAHAMGFIEHVIEQDGWSDAIAAQLARVQALSSTATTQLLDLTRTDSREQDIAAIVASAGRPGLRDRVGQFREQAAASRNAKRSRN